MQQKIHTSIQLLMQRDMDRKDFIKHVGIGIVALTGVAAMLKTVTQLSGTSEQKSSSNLGYGSSPYGGSNQR